MFGWLNRWPPGRSEKDQNRSDERGQSPLIAAASFGQREVVQRLLQALRLDRRLLLKTTGGWWL